MNSFDYLDIIENCGVDRHILSQACKAHGYKWPQNLTSGVMFYNGTRILQRPFMAFSALQKDAA